MASMAWMTPTVPTVIGAVPSNTAPIPAESVLAAPTVSANPPPMLPQAKTKTRSAIIRPRQTASAMAKGSLQTEESEDASEVRRQTRSANVAEAVTVASEVHAQENAIELEEAVEVVEENEIVTASSELPAFGASALTATTASNATSPRDGASVPQMVSKPKVPIVKGPASRGPVAPPSSKESGRSMLLHVVKAKPKGVRPATGEMPPPKRLRTDELSNEPEPRQRQKQQRTRKEALEPQPPRYPPPSMLLKPTQEKIMTNLSHEVQCPAACVAFSATSSATQCEAGKSGAIVGDVQFPTSGRTQIGPRCSSASGAFGRGDPSATTRGRPFVAAPKRGVVPKDGSVATATCAKLGGGTEEKDGTAVNQGPHLSPSNSDELMFGVLKGLAASSKAGSVGGKAVGGTCIGSADSTATRPVVAHFNGEGLSTMPVPPPGAALGQKSPSTIAPAYSSHVHDTSSSDVRFVTTPASVVLRHQFEKVAPPAAPAGAPRPPPPPLRFPPKPPLGVPRLVGVHPAIQENKNIPTVPVIAHPGKTTAVMVTSQNIAAGVQNLSALDENLPTMPAAARRLPLPRTYQWQHHGIPGTIPETGGGQEMPRDPRRAPAGLATGTVAVPDREPASHRVVPPPPPPPRVSKAVAPATPNGGSRSACGGVSGNVSTASVSSLSEAVAAFVVQPQGIVATSTATDVASNALGPHMPATNLQQAARLVNVNETKTDEVHGCEPANDVKANEIISNGMNVNESANEIGPKEVKADETKADDAREEVSATEANANEGNINEMNANDAFSDCIHEAWQIGAAQWEEENEASDKASVDVEMEDEESDERLIEQEDMEGVAEAETVEGDAIAEVEGRSEEQEEEEDDEEQNLNEELAEGNETETDENDDEVGIACVTDDDLTAAWPEFGEVDSWAHAPVVGQRPEETTVTEASVKALCALLQFPAPHSGASACKMERSGDKSVDEGVSESTIVDALRLLYAWLWSDCASRVQAWLDNCSARSILVKLLADSRAVGFWACHVIGRAVDRNERNAESLANEGAIGAICAFVDKHSADAEVHLAGVSVLNYFAQSLALKQRIVSEGAISRLLVAMEGYEVA
eukprot:TRINITY_DN32306_c0_g1_i1.p1 TRINITY_DN32306_c0_g1~~TRINITY_DN32306_c0_g1_i1.p1  ORF type:complete len:1184 (+),score=218.91 TRINITY_DN32306_c0_g1_i1:269-3553(+)